EDRGPGGATLGADEEDLGRRPRQAAELEAAPRVGPRAARAAGDPGALHREAALVHDLARDARLRLELEHELVPGRAAIELAPQRSPAGRLDVEGPAREAGRQPRELEASVLRREHGTGARAAHARAGDRPAVARGEHAAPHGGARARGELHGH